MFKSILNEDESACVYFFENTLPRWSSYHREQRGQQSYKEYAEAAYNRHVERCKNSKRTPLPYDSIKMLDWEAEYAAALSEKIMNDLISMI